MSRHDDRVTLRQIVEHAREAIEHSQSRSRSDLDSDRVLELALTRLIEIVGEACTRLSVDERQRLESIPWSAWIGMRNRLIHAYDSVDRDILWQVVTIDLPALVLQLGRSGRT